MADKVIPVRVALRVRPLVTKEICDGCQICIKHVPKEPQVIVGRDKAFTFDHVFDHLSTQEALYNKSIADRIDCLFKGYNVTVLAYGQTGSGKTFTMGTAYSSSFVDEEAKIGVIQRAIADIFKGIKQNTTSTFTIKVSFLEVYKEEVFDLLQRNRETPIFIRDNSDGINIVGLTEQVVTSCEETLYALETGSLSRTTASTAMNSRSSRSHAIFTIILEQCSIHNELDIKRGKFHLVDLAGSERAHKTETLGVRFKEGVNINRGLLALGNVISALCDDSSHVPYRDSKLTRLLQDSLGGNSHTVMIACVSPADVNFDETVNTLRYADRAKKIKNKPIINRDPQNDELIRLRELVSQLQSDKMQMPIMSLKDSKVNSDRNGEEGTELTARIKQLDMENRRLTKELKYSLEQSRILLGKMMSADSNKNVFIKTMKEVKLKTEKITVELKELEINDDIIERLESVLVSYDELLSTLTDSTKIEDDLEDNPMELDSDGNVDIEDQELDMESTLKRAALSRELQELEHILAEKEELALKMHESGTEMASMRLHFEANVKQMEEEIMTLQREKDDLSSALKAAKAHTNTNKISEQRRKRMQELELKIADMKKTINDKNKTRKLRDDAEKKVSALQQEIQMMKTTRVKLMKQIKEEYERFRSLKAEKDREVAQLKQQERKRLYEMSKMATNFSKQNTVIKRKLEEAAAANRRLHDALHHQQQVAERRSKEKQFSVQGIGTRVQLWLNQEIEVILRSKEAQYHLQNLLDDRKTIADQLRVMHKDFANGEPPKKKGTLPRNLDYDSSEEKDAILSHENELSIRNAQISDLQQQILNADQDDKNKHRWETVNSLVEAKCAMKFLFESLIAAKMEAFSQSESNSATIEAMQSQIKIQQENQVVLNNAKDNLTKCIRNLKHTHEQKISQLNREYEDKTLCLLKQLNCSGSSSVDPDEALKERMKFQEQEIERLEYLHEELVRKNEENTYLKEQLEEARSNRNKQPLLSKICEVGQKQIKKPRVEKKQDSVIMELFDALEENGSTDDENDENDPDWRLTPMIKRNRSQTSVKDNSGSKKITNQASTSASGCSCKYGCGTKKCGCFKLVKPCSELCKCGENCSNKHPNTSDNSIGESVINTTFNASRPPLKNIERFSETLNSSEEFVLPHEKMGTLNPKSIIDDSGIVKRSFSNKSQRYFRPI